MWVILFLKLLWKVVNDVVRFEFVLYIKFSFLLIEVLGLRFGLL